MDGLQLSCGVHCCLKRNVIGVVKIDRDEQSMILGANHFEPRGLQAGMEHRKIIESGEMERNVVEGAYH